MIYLNRPMIFTKKNWHDFEEKVPLSRLLLVVRKSFHYTIFWNLCLIIVILDIFFRLMGTELWRLYRDMINTKMLGTLVLLSMYVFLSQFVISFLDQTCDGTCVKVYLKQGLLKLRLKLVTKLRVFASSTATKEVLTVCLWITPGSLRRFFSMPFLFIYFVSWCAKAIENQKYLMIWLTNNSSGYRFGEKLDPNSMVPQLEMITRTTNYASAYCAW